MDIYSLSRDYWNFAFENPEKIKPNHAALYFFAIEHCNRLGWKKKFGLPTTMAMEAIGIKSYNTFINTMHELVDFGGFIIIEKSKNQYSSNIIALSNFNKALDKALDKALIKHTTKQSESTHQSTSESISSIDIQDYNNTNLPIDHITNESIKEIDSVFENFWNSYPLKTGKAKSLIAFKKIKLGARENFFEYLGQYVEYLQVAKWRQASAPVVFINKFLKNGRDEDYLELKRVELEKQNQSSTPRQQPPQSISKDQQAKEALLRATEKRILENPDKYGNSFNQS